MYFNFPEEYLVPVTLEEITENEDRIMPCEGCRSFREEEAENIFAEADEEFVNNFLKNMYYFYSLENYKSLNFG